MYQYLTVVWPSHCSSFLLSREPEALSRAAFSLCRHREAEHLAREMAFVSDFFCDGAEAQGLFMSRARYWGAGCGGAIQALSVAHSALAGVKHLLAVSLLFFCRKFCQHVMAVCGRPLFSLCPSILRSAGLFFHTAPLICSVS